MPTRRPADDATQPPPWDGSSRFAADGGRRQLAGRLVLGAAVPALTLVRAAGRDVPVSAWAIALAALVGVAMFYGRRWPALALAVALAGTVGSQLSSAVDPVLLFASEVAVFNLARLRPRRTAALGGFAAAAVLLTVAWVDTSGPVTEPRTLIVAVWTLLAFAFGDGVRTQRAYVRSIAERARRAEETREQEARARVAEERVRIARELHDVVAHHIAVINIHAGLARRALGRDEAVVLTSLGHVQDAARTVLDELGTVLRVLRSPDEGPGTEPSPGLDRVDELLATFAAAGFSVRTAVTGRPREMDRTCDLAAYRIIQEALTNASKYGSGGQAELSLVYGADDVTIAVSNLVRIDPANGQAGLALGARDGQGLVGMRERAAGCGGTLAARLDGEGVFRLAADIPYHPVIDPAVHQANDPVDRPAEPRIPRSL